MSYGNGKNPLAPASSPAPHNVYEAQFNQVLGFHAEDRMLLIETQAEIENSFEELRKLLIGSDNAETFAKVRTAILTDGQRVGIDRSGWSVSATDKFASEMTKIEKGSSLYADIFLHMISILSKADEIRNIHVEHPLNINPNSANSQGQQFIQEKKPGLIDQFKSFIGGLRSQAQQEKEHAISLVSGIFNEFSEVPAKLELFKSQHWQNVGKVVEFDAAGFAATKLDELEALDDLRGRYMRMFDMGSRLLRIQQMKDLSNIANNIMQAQSMQLQQQQQQMNQQKPFIGPKT